VGTCYTHSTPFTTYSSNYSPGILHRKYCGVKGGVASEEGGGLVLGGGSGCFLGVGGIKKRIRRASIGRKEGSAKSRGLGQRGPKGGGRRGVGGERR